VSTTVYRVRIVSMFTLARRLDAYARDTPEYNSNLGALKVMTKGADGKW
jgi:hypothetical protein